MAETSTTQGGAGARPLSPHIQVWKWHVTMATSITHRVTGVGNAIGAVLLTWWLISAATGPEAYGVFADFISSWLGQFFLFGFTASLVYHVLNGIRHLFWDTGAGFSLETSRMTGFLVYGIAVVVTLGIWVLGYANMGGGQ